MNQPSPAIVTQEAARRLPRAVLWLLSLAYILPGYLGRDPWRGADMASLGFMRQLQQAGNLSEWLQPQLFGLAADPATLLPYWLGAGALLIAPEALPAHWVVRLPFMLMLLGTLAASWYAIYHLARHASAQPVAFAFGGEARPVDYARALADGGLLALIATLGLAQFSHEAAPALVQLFFSSLIFYALAALPAGNGAALPALLLGLPGLMLSGAPGMAVVYGAAGILLLLHPGNARRNTSVALLAAVTVICLLIAWSASWLDTSKLLELRTEAGDWSSLARLMLWFGWPAWLLALWTLWRWRRQLLRPSSYRHLSLPLLMAGVPLAHVLLSRHGYDRSLLLSLPGLAALAAFALPTLRRSASALIDWFTVLFFTAAAIVIWVVWISLQTGVPAKPAANVGRLAPGFESIFQWPALLAAVLGTLAWLALVRWRTGRHRTALWKSLVLPAAGATLCWLLLMSLWLPALDYGRSEAAQMRQVQALLGPDAGCVQTHGLNASQLSALNYFGGWTPQLAAATDADAVACPWLIVDIAATDDAAAQRPMTDWQLLGHAQRPTRRDDMLLVYGRR